MELQLFRFCAQVAAVWPKSRLRFDEIHTALDHCGGVFLSLRRADGSTDPMEFIGVWLIFICAGMAFALIPGLMAKNKGRSFWGFFALGFFFFLPALIAAMYIEDKTKERPFYGYGGPPSVPPAGGPPYGVWGNALLPGQTAPGPKKTVYVRNCYVNLPLRPVKAEIRKNPDQTTALSVLVKSYRPGAYESLIVRMEGYDTFHDISELLVFSEEQIVRSLRKADNGFWLDCTLRCFLQPDAVGYLDVYILAYALEGRAVQVTDGEKCGEPLRPQDLGKHKMIVGPDAVTYFAETEGGWRCVCGTLCSSEVCDMCGRTLEDMRNPNEKAAAIGRFLEQVQGSRDPNELKESLQALNGALNPAQYEEAVKYADSLISLKRMYNIDVGEKEREKLKSILG